MYSDHRNQDGAARTVAHGVDDAQARESFRPVALPALAAAVHIGRQAAEAARARLAARRTVRIVYEDEPVV
ncbi:hypothetical protein [Methylobacterium gnaphalii]|uniref:Uncharacterized protein n=1 Tax=Methylobacterium gnaphalii TaxID=1010610 RepID=A0A512JPJ9_9HYPH|nr:hypothetical protein [Methylobacterium gnaphalii]GEP11886.1 hypothetical protein MGN01_37310 [Methylobacterium gnaphalii]GJD68954.1 hypothetical protein MMMDOFMJ_1880 [Methylobacterium gnaphalii]GLS47678.1 hypothetical protein GCM10007885_05220 [Methylobacterium gnaphalii]